MPLRVVVIVEGHGEDGAIRTLLERVWYEMLGGDSIEVVPWRASQGRLRQKEGLGPVVEAAAIKLHAGGRGEGRRLLLILIDSEGEECPKATAPERAAAREVRTDAATEIACVMPNPMFETWFAAAALSLRGKNDLPADLPKPADPEAEGIGKTWLRKHLPRKYKETIDQPRFVGSMSLDECRSSSRSFRKLVKVLEQCLPTAEPADGGEQHGRP